VLKTRGFFLGKRRSSAGSTGGRRHGGRRDGLTPVLRVEDRATEIARQCRPQDRPGIILRQTGQSICRGAVLGRIEFFTVSAHVAGLERIDQRPADAEERDSARHRPASCATGG
jgi:hypothetical protein